MVIKFNSQKISEAEKHYDTIHMAKEQMALVGPIAKVISDQIQIPDRAVKGFIWRVAKEWQKTNKKDLSEARNLSVSERISIFEDIFGSVKNLLKNVLIDSSQEALLDKAMNEAFSVYQNQSR